MACAQTAVAAAGREVLGFGLLLGLILLAAAGKGVLYDTLDPDAFWHVRVAEQIQRDGVRPLVDDISFSSIHQPWTPYSWLAELTMKSVWDHAGLRGAVLTHAACAAAIVTLLASSCLIMRCGTGDASSKDSDGPLRVHRATLLPILFATMTGAILSLPYLSFRPVTMAIVVLAAVSWLLIRDRAMGERSRAVWLVPPLTALATNLHIFAVLAPLWLTALFVGAAWECRAAPADQELRRRLRRYVMLWAAVCLGWMMTPLLGGTVQTMIHYQLLDPMVASPVIREMQPFYHGVFGMVILTIVLGCIAYRRDRSRAGEIVWLLGMAVLLMRHGRFAPVFALIAMPMFARAMPSLSDRALGKPAIVYAVAVLLCVGLVRVVNALPSRDASLSAWLNRHGPDTPGYPCAAADFVASDLRPARGRIINEFSWGGYLAWRLGPNGYRVLLDGRTQLFSPEFWRRACLGPVDESRQLLCTTDADAAVLPITGSRFAPCLRSLGWRRAYADDRAEVLVPPSSIANAK
jgi:hypothetical protein